jgi:hypothetical protein
VAEEQQAAGRISYRYSLDFVYKSGRTDRLLLGPLGEKALPEILEKLRGLGVPLAHPENLPE